MAGEKWRQDPEDFTGPVEIDVSPTLSPEAKAERERRYLEDDILAALEDSRDIIYYSERQAVNQTLRQIVQPHVLWKTYAFIMAEMKDAGFTSETGEVLDEPGT